MSKLSEHWQMQVLTLKKALQYEVEDSRWRDDKGAKRDALENAITLADSLYDAIYIAYRND